MIFATCEIAVQQVVRRWRFREGGVNGLQSAKFCVFIVDDVAVLPLKFPPHEKKSFVCHLNSTMFNELESHSSSNCQKFFFHTLITPHHSVASIFHFPGHLKSLNGIFIASNLIAQSEVFLCASSCSQADGTEHGNFLWMNFVFFLWWCVMEQDSMSEHNEAVKAKKKKQIAIRGWKKKQRPKKQPKENTRKNNISCLGV